MRKDAPRCRFPMVECEAAAVSLVRRRRRSVPRHWAARRLLESTGWSSPARGQAGRPSPGHGCHSGSSTREIPLRSYRTTASASCRSRSFIFHVSCWSACCRARSSASSKSMHLLYGGGMTLRHLVVALGNHSVDRVGTWRGAYAEPRTAAALLTTGPGPMCPVLPSQPSGTSLCVSQAAGGWMRPRGWGARKGRCSPLT